MDCSGAACAVCACREVDRMKMYFKFFSLHLKKRMAYKKSFFLWFFGQFLNTFAAFASIYFLMSRFESVNGYTIGDCMLCASIIVMAFSLAEVFFRGFDTFQIVVREAQFDRILTRPRGLIFQLLCERIEFERFGKLLQALIMLIYGITASAVVWTPWRICTLILMVLGGTIVFASLFLLYAAICFFTLDGLEFMNVLTHGAREFGAYPIDVYGRGILKFCTYLVPYALFQYYPLQYLLGRAASPLYGLLPLLTPLFTIPCYCLWRYGVKKYKSSGS